MATSGTYTYGTTGTEIITAAFRKCGVLSEGETASAEMSVNALQALEMLVKAWQAEGIHLWKYEEMVLFLVENQKTYDLGPSGSNWLKKSALVETTLSADAASAAATVTLTSVTGVATTYYIGIVLDDNTIHWTTVNGAPAGFVVTLATVLDGAATSGNTVYVYAAKGPRPLQVTGGRVQIDSSNENILDLVSRDEYFNLSNKAASGTPVEAHYNPLLTNGKLYMWPTTDDERTYLNLTVQLPIEDFTSAANNPDIPQEWYLPLVWCLAQQIYLEYGVIDPMTVQKIEKEADKWYEKISDFDAEDTSLVLSIDYSG